MKVMSDAVDFVTANQSSSSRSSVGPGNSAALSRSASQSATPVYIPRTTSTVIRIPGQQIQLQDADTSTPWVLVNSLYVVSDIEWPWTSSQGHDSNVWSCVLEVCYKRLIIKWANYCTLVGVRRLLLLRCLLWFVVCCLYRKKSRLSSTSDDDPDGRRQLFLERNRSVVCSSWRVSETVVALCIWA